MITAATCSLSSTCSTSARSFHSQMTTSSDAASDSPASIGGRSEGLGDRARAHEERVEPAVVVPDESEHLRAACGGPCDPHREQVHLGAGETQADALDPRHRVDEPLAELRFELVLAGEGLADLQRVADRVEHARVVVAEDHRTHAARVVDVLVSVDVPHVRTGGAGERQRHGAAGQPDVGIHATGDDARPPPVLLDAPRVTRRRCRVDGHWVSSFLRAAVVPRRRAWSGGATALMYRTPRPNGPCCPTASRQSRR